MKKKQAVAWIFAALFVLSIVLSLFFISGNVEHECVGADCPVCSVLQVAEEVCGAAKIAAAIVSLFFVATFFAVKSVKPLSVSAVTPVSLSDILIN